jgi:hypothetical protein
MKRLYIILLVESSSHRIAKDSLVRLFGMRLIFIIECKRDEQCNESQPFFRYSIYFRYILINCYIHPQERMQQPYPLPM